MPPPFNVDSIYAISLLSLGLDNQGNMNTGSIIFKNEPCIQYARAKLYHNGTHTEYLFWNMYRVATAASTSMGE